MTRRALVLVILLSLALASSAQAKPTWTNTRMAGLWITPDCLTAGEPPAPRPHYFDCGIPAPETGLNLDASAMSLNIGSGAVPMVRLVDTYATYCVNHGMSPRFVAEGHGTFTVYPETLARTMVVTWTVSRCGTELTGLDPLEPTGLYLGQADDPAYDSLWDDVPIGEDTDWGYLWERAN